MIIIRLHLNTDLILLYGILKLLSKFACCKKRIVSFICFRKRLKSNRHGIELNIEVEPLNGFQYDFSTTVEKGSSYLSVSFKIKCIKTELHFFTAHRLMIYITDFNKAP